MKSIIRTDSLQLTLFGDPKAQSLLLQPMDARELEGAEQIAALIRQGTDRPFALAAIEIADWNGALSPWPAPPVFGKQSFAGEAQKTLDALQQALPAVEHAVPNAARRYLGGYSLAGLFALWAAYETRLFDGVAAVSPSVWFPGWPQYAQARPVQARRVYLSLGDREARTKNPVMAAVGENLRRQDALLAADPGCLAHTLVWNPGNHFQDSERRTAAGFVWLLEGETDAASASA